jgi:hypothetical protein
LLRDKILLGLGSIIVGGLSLAAVFGNIHSTDVALACLTVGAGLLGAPTILRWDEAAAQMIRRYPRTAPAWGCSGPRSLSL